MSDPRSTPGRRQTARERHQELKAEREAQRLARLDEKRRLRTESLRPSVQRAGKERDAAAAEEERLAAARRLRFEMADALRDKARLVLADRGVFTMGEVQQALAVLLLEALADDHPTDETRPGRRPT